MSERNKKPGATLISTGNDVRAEPNQLGGDLKGVFLFMGAQYVESSGEQHIHIVFRNDVLESLHMQGKAEILEALQKAAEYVADSMGASSASAAS